MSKKRRIENPNQLTMFGAMAPVPKPPAVEVTYGCPPEHVGAHRGRPGRVYIIQGDPMRLIRISDHVDPEHQYVLQRLDSPGAFRLLSQRRFFKATQCRHTGTLRPGDRYKVPCIGCRVPTQQPGSLFCTTCLTERAQWRSVESQKAK